MTHTVYVHGKEVTLNVDSSHIQEIFDDACSQEEAMVTIENYLMDILMSDTVMSPEEFLFN